MALAVGEARVLQQDVELHALVGVEGDPRDGLEVDVVEVGVVAGREAEDRGLQRRVAVQQVRLGQEQREAAHQRQVRQAPGD